MAAAAGLLQICTFHLVGLWASDKLNLRDFLSILILKIINNNIFYFRIQIFIENKKTKNKTQFLFVCGGKKRERVIIWVGLFEL